RRKRWRHEELGDDRYPLPYDSRDRTIDEVAPTRMERHARSYAAEGVRDECRAAAVARGEGEPRHDRDYRSGHENNRVSEPAANELVEDDRRRDHGAEGVREVRRTNEEAAQDSPPLERQQ